MKRKTKSRKRTKVKDLTPSLRRARKVKGGFVDVCKTPTPGGPVAIPYPN